MRDNKWKFFSHFYFSLFFAHFERNILTGWWMETKQFDAVREFSNYHNDRSQTQGILIVIRRHSPQLLKVTLSRQTSMVLRNVVVSWSIRPLLWYVLLLPHCHLWFNQLHTEKMDKMWNILEFQFHCVHIVSFSTGKFYWFLPLYVVIIFCIAHTNSNKGRGYARVNGMCRQCNIWRNVSTSQCYNAIFKESFTHTINKLSIMFYCERKIRFVSHTVLPLDAWTFVDLFESLLYRLLPSAS